MPNLRPRRLASQVFVVLAAALLGAEAQSAPTPQQIVERINEAYVHARTYEALFRTDMTLRSKGTLAMLVHVQMIPGKKMRFEVTSPSSARSLPGPQMPNKRVLVVDNGREVWVYFPGSRQYLHGKHMGTFRPALMSYGFVLGSLDAAASPWRIVRAGRTSNGGNCVVESVRPVPLGRFEGLVRIFVDASGKKARRIEMSAPSGGPPIRVTVTILEERMNGPIPSSAFAFKLPAGAHPAAPSTEEPPLGPPPVP